MVAPGADWSWVPNAPMSQVVPSPERSWMQIGPGSQDPNLGLCPTGSMEFWQESKDLGQGFRNLQQVFEDLGKGSRIHGQAHGFF